MWATDSKGKAYLFNERIVRDGFASFKTNEDNAKYDVRLKKAESTANKKKAGLWGACSGPHAEIIPTPQPGAADRPGVIGDTFTVDGLAITLTDATYLDGILGVAPKGGYVYLVVGVSIKNVSESGKTHRYNSSNFAAIDLDTKATFDDTFAFLDQPLDSGELSPGEFVSGQVALEIQNTSTNVRVKYDSGQKAYWLVPR